MATWIQATDDNLPEHDTSVPLKVNGEYDFGWCDHSVKRFFTHSEGEQPYRNVKWLSESPSTPLSVEEAAKEYGNQNTDISMFNVPDVGIACRLSDAFLAGAAHREKPPDFLPVLEENLKAQIDGQKMNDPEIWGGYDCFKAVIETYEDLISIYKRGSWGKNSQPSSTPITSDIVKQLEKIMDGLCFANGDTGYDGFGLCVSKLRELLSSQPSQKDYEEVLADHQRLVRELDVLLNGEDGAAKNPSLCDIVAQVEKTGVVIKSSQGSVQRLIDALKAISISRENANIIASEALQEFNSGNQTEKEGNDYKLPGFDENMENLDNLTIKPK